MSAVEDHFANLPEHVRPLRPDESFVFGCHPGVDCFTDCCRDLELALTPYDVLRLRQGLAMSSAEFLDRHVVIERGDGAFPRLYLGMVDDGRASCPFVSPAGCVVYEHRPGACRAYPTGRAALRLPDGSMQHYHVLLREPHCHGFSGDSDQSAAVYGAGEGLAPYNEFSDALTAILHHPRRQAGMRLSVEQEDLFILALYDQDAFRHRLAATETGADLPAAGDNEALLHFGMRWLLRELYDENVPGE